MGCRWPNQARGGESRGVSNNNVEVDGAGLSRPRRLGESGTEARRGREDRIGSHGNNVAWDERARAGQRGVRVVIHHENRRLGSRGRPPPRRGRGVVEGDGRRGCEQKPLVEGRGRRKGVVEVRG
uniref:Uncharacterized protein n=1 Tax=Arundo donax TaxID=35708 RepID=A0A0A8YLE5_ARUDO